MLFRSVAKPANNYVADFIRDISKSHVLTLKYLARPAKSNEVTDGPELQASMIIRDASKIIVQSMKPVQVIDNGKKIGIVSSEDVLKLISGDNL